MERYIEKLTDDKLYMARQLYIEGRWMDDGGMDGGGMEGWLDAQTNSGRVDIKYPALSSLLGYALAIKL